MSEGNSVKARKPSAEARTISLFSGQTDIEGGPAARDGIMPLEGGPRAPKATKWISINGFTWALGDKDSGTLIQRHGPTHYVAQVRGLSLGPYPNMRAACSAVEERL